jgi:sucrose-6-phosphate hydrolase SacC (GH32 family)
LPDTHVYHRNDGAISISREGREGAKPREESLPQGKLKQYQLKQFKKLRRHKASLPQKTSSRIFAPSRPSREIKYSKVLTPKRR